MNILGIETSCDETAAAIVKDGEQLLANTVASQVDIHKVYGGVVPEVAARSHIEAMTPVLEETLVAAFGEADWSKIDAIGVTRGPGLSGSLLIGTIAARTLAWAKNKPLYGVDHVKGHVYANFIDPESDTWKSPSFPLLALIVSGGHSQLALFEDHENYRLLGQTQDDAVGEAFDKVAKILGLPYPGGPAVSVAAEKGNDEAFKFPDAKLQNPYDFSFSGLKTAVLRRTQALLDKPYDFPSVGLAELLSEEQVNDIAASFQRTAVDTMVDKVLKAYEEFKPKTVVIAGGVAANQELRKTLKERLPIHIEYAPMNLCTDNAAMIATLAYYHAKENKADDPLKLGIDPSLSM